MTKLTKGQRCTRLAAEEKIFLTQIDLLKLPEVVLRQLEVLQEEIKALQHEITEIFDDI